MHECSSLEHQQPLSFISPSPSNNELAASVPTIHNPTVHHILENMNYQGKGLGLHEQGILEPIHVNVPPPSYGLGYIPQGEKSQDVATFSTPPKSTTFHHTSYPIPKTYVAIPPPSSYNCQKHVTIHLPPSNPPPLLLTPNSPLCILP